MAFVKPTILGLRPENTIKIHSLGGGLLGISDNYQMIVGIEVSNIGVHYIAELAIVNSNFYLFDDGSPVKTFSFQANHMAQEIALPFRVRNRSDISGGALPLVMSVCTYDKAEGSGAKLCSNGSFRVVWLGGDLSISNFE